MIMDETLKEETRLFQGLKEKHNKGMMMKETEMNTRAKSWGVSGPKECRLHSEGNLWEVWNICNWGLIETHT